MTWCEAHLERAGEHRPAYRAGLCRDCWAGKPIHAAAETLREYPLASRLRMAGKLRARLADPAVRAEMSARRKKAWREQRADA